MESLNQINLRKNFLLVYQKTPEEFKQNCIQEFSKNIPESTLRDWILEDLLKNNQSLIPFFIGDSSIEEGLFCATLGKFKGKFPYSLTLEHVGIEGISQKTYFPSENDESTL